MKSWSELVLIMSLIGTSLTSAKEGKRTDLPEGAIGMHTESIQLSTTLMTQRGLRGELSPPEPIVVNEVELNFYKMKDGSLTLILDKSYIRSKKDEKGYTPAKALNNLDTESLQKISKAFLKQRKDYEHGDKDFVYNKLKPRKPQPKKPGSSK